MSSQLTETQRAALRALCNTFVPALKVANDPIGFWGRSASDMGVDVVIAQQILPALPEPLRAGLLGILDELAAQNFLQASQGQREAILARLSLKSGPSEQLLSFYEKQTMLFNYGLPAEPGPNENVVTYGSPYGFPQGQNPNWEVLGYPGPATVPPKYRPKQIQPFVPQTDNLNLDADVCVVGSGAGGAVIASRMAAAGYSVIMLESGGYYSSSDFHQLELWGYKHLWYKGGATPTANGDVTLLAGGTLGGGTEINWMNCVRTPDLVRQDWAQNYGLTGVDTPEFEAYINTVEQRIMASSQTAYYNSQNLRMREGCERLGYLSKQTQINWDPAIFQPLLAGYTGFGDQTGAKRTARRTYVLDAYRSGARIIVNCRADRIVVEQGRAAGVEATYSGSQGRTAKISVRAPQVVVAGGSLESPALLLRSGIGGPAVGKYLRVQPGGAVYGVYKERQRGWWGSPMTTNCEQFVDTGDGFGFYMEIPAFGPGFVASVIPWASGKQHKEVMTKVPHISTFIWFLRDQGWGEVTIDAQGNSVPVYSLTNELDQKNFRHATAEAIRIHEAAGAEEVLISLAHKQIVWKRGQSLEEFIQLIMKQPLLHGAQPMISAHQLCTCRMGKDPAISVANTNGELYDVKGVWIGDASACPTALGANPMVTIMALAERTADKMMASSSRSNLNSMLFGTSGESRDSDPLSTMTAGILNGLASLMAAPFRILSTGQQMFSSLSGQARNIDPTVFCHIIELTTRPGQGRAVVEAIRDNAIPRVIQPAIGFIDEIVLLSRSDPDHVTAFSFWRSKDDSDRFDQYGFDQVTGILQSLLAAAPERRPFDVGASTNFRIHGWFSGLSRGLAQENMPPSSNMPSTAMDLAKGMMDLMIAPLRILTTGQQMFASLSGQVTNMDPIFSAPPITPGTTSTVFCHIIELTTKPGQGRAVVEAIRDNAIPRVIQPAIGFIDEIVLLSRSDPDHVTAFSFWRSKDDSDRFDQYGFDQVTAILQSLLAVAPERRPFDVGASTNPRIHGWFSAPASQAGTVEMARL